MTTLLAAGIGFPGTDTRAYGFIGEVLLDEPPAAVVSEHNTEGAVIVLPLGGGRYRVTGYDPARQSPDDELTLAELRDVAVRVTGHDFGMRDPSWLTRFGDATRHAEVYRRGRVLLAGDAAHMHWPAGGVGLNVGLQDAMNLGWRLAADVQGRAAPGLLDGYQAERHPVGTALAEYTLAQGALITATGPDGQALRAVLSELLAAHSPVARALAVRLTALDVAYPPADPAAHPLVGSRAPVAAPAGLLRAGRPLVLDPGDVLVRAPGHAGERGIATLTGPVDGWPEVGAVIVRPDGHVWWAADASAADLDSAVVAALGSLEAVFPRSA